MAFRLPLLMLPVLVLSAALAPAPFTRPAAPAASAVLAAPGGARQLADLLNSPGFIRGALLIKFPIAAPPVSEAWARERFRAAPRPDGKSVSLTVERCTPDEGLRLLEAAVEAHLRRVVSGRGERLRGMDKRLREAANKLPPKHQALIRDYVRRLYIRDAEGVVLAWPRLSPLTAKPSAAR